MKYIVVQMLQVEVDQGPDAWPTIMPVTETEVTPVLCETTRDVFKAIMESHDDADGDWAIFEVVDGKAVRRAVTFIYDGNLSYDVKIS